MLAISDKHVWLDVFILFKWWKVRSFFFLKGYQFVNLIPILLGSCVHKAKLTIMPLRTILMMFELEYDLKHRYQKYGSQERQDCTTLLATKYSLLLKGLNKVIWYKSFYPPSSPTLSLPQRLWTRANFLLISLKWWLEEYLYCTFSFEMSSLYYFILLQYTFIAFTHWIL